MYQDFLDLVEHSHLTNTENTSHKFISRYVSRETFLKIERYIEILFNWNQAFNLISRKYNQKTFIEQQILPCINLFLLLNNINRERPNKGGVNKESANEGFTKIYDIGSGAGLPGIILSILGMRNLILVERSSKRSEFQRYAIRELELESISTLNIDVKNLHITCENEKIAIVSKAVASCDWIITSNSSFSNINTTIYLMKSAMQKQELRSVDKELFSTKIHDNIFDSKDCVFEIRSKTEKLNYE